MSIRNPTYTPGNKPAKGGNNKIPVGIAIAAEKGYNQQVGSKTVPYPVWTNFTLAPWASSDRKKDDWLRLKEEYILRGQPYGKLIANEKDLEDLQHKKET